MTSPGQGGDETVFLAPRRKCYHTDVDCSQLDRARTVFEKSLREVAELPQCRFCSGEYDPPSTTDSHALRRKLEALDPDEI